MTRAEERRWPQLELLSDASVAFWRRAMAPLRISWRRSWLYRRSLKGKMSDRIVFHPADPMPRRLEGAELLLRGRFRFAGATVDVDDGSVFDASPPSTDWACAMHAFEWLPPLAAAGGEAAKTLATNLMTQWMRRNARYGEPAWSADVMGYRLVNIFAHGRFVLANSDVLWRSKLFVSLREQARVMSRSVDEATDGLPRLAAAVAQVLCGTCLSENAGRLNASVAQLEGVIGNQILADGGHITRSPEALLEAYRLLEMAMDALAAADAAIPSTLRNAHDRMAPMLRFFRHSDGALALFNGGAEGEPRMVEALLARDEVRGQPFTWAPHSAFQRLAAGRSIVVMDCGTVPSGAMSTHAHAGCLAFEFSAGSQRLVVNCGPEIAGLDWNGVSRSTAAHSTITLADTSMAHVLAPGMMRDLVGARMTAGPSRVETSRLDSAESVRVDAVHDGYVPRFGVSHERTLSLTPRGNALAGVDRLLRVERRASPGALAFAARFHIHPDVRLSPSQGGDFLLKLPNGDGWRFRSSADCRIEESVYLGAGKFRRGEQVVIGGGIKDAPVELTWSFEQL